MQWHSECDCVKDYHYNSENKVKRVVFSTAAIVMDY